VSDPDGVRGVRSGTGPASVGLSREEAPNRPQAASNRVGGKPVRLSCSFMSIVFLSGIFIGASLIPAVPGRAPLGDIHPVPAASPIGTPPPGSAITGSGGAPGGARPMETVPAHPSNPSRPARQRTRHPRRPNLGASPITAGTPVAARLPIAAPAQPPTTAR
jgi:hypothetical protein